METVYRLLITLLLLATAAIALPSDSDFHQQSKRESANPIAPYAPTPGTCPAGPLVRTANGLSSAEQQWVNRRRPRADQAMRNWVSRFGSFPASSMPLVGSAVAGGYIRASLLGAGIHQQLDGRQGQGPMAGLLDAITYEATLSAATGYQAGLIQNNWPTIASLSSGLWEPNFATGMMPGAAQGQMPQAVASIVADITAKTAASFPSTLVDVFGRLIGWGNLYNNGGVASLISDARNQPRFINAEVPFPIFTGIGTKNGYSCYPGANGTQYEMTPFDFGSWDYGIRAFMDIRYLGTRMRNGSPLMPVCTTGFDNLSFMTGIACNVLAWNCRSPSGTPADGALGSTPIFQPPFNQVLDTVVGAATLPLNRNFYAPIPNPFFGMAGSPAVANDAELQLVDGGNSGQVIPLWPMLQRNVDVVFAWDNYYDVFGTYTSGGQIYNTYTASGPAQLRRMPVIPPPNEFMSRGLNTRPTAFGCNDRNLMTIIYVPYQDYVPQTQQTSNTTTTPQQTRDYIRNGNLLVTNNGNEVWPRCVACLMMRKRASSLPSFCNACFSQYCYN